MTDVKCADCEEYRNEWCEKIIDSPHPDMLRDCQYWHERKDMVEVIRCEECVHANLDELPAIFSRCMVHNRTVGRYDYCSWAERKKS